MSSIQVLNQYYAKGIKMNKNGHEKQRIIEEFSNLSTESKTEIRIL